MPEIAHVLVIDRGERKSHHYHYNRHRNSDSDKGLTIILWQGTKETGLVWISMAQACTVLPGVEHPRESLLQSRSNSYP